MNVRIQIRAIALLCCLLLTHWAFSQTTRYVSTTGLTPAATATSWATSTTDLQGAINASQPGDQVWVAAGVYKPTATTGPDSRTISFSMKNGVAIYGGFLGSETIFSQRPPVNPVAGHPSSSTLSGEIGNPASTTDNSYHVISNPAGLTTTAVLDGFVITGGRANGGGYADFGGAMYNNNSSPTLTNCSLQGNSADYGGAMYNLYSSSPTLTNCSLQGNSAGVFGGAMYNFDSSPTLTNCSLQGNSDEFSGGAMFNHNSSPTLANCSLQGNSAGIYGGAMASIDSSPTLTNCSLQSNSAGIYGGAMYNSNSFPTLTNCSLQGNSAESSGGAMYNVDSSPALTNCVLQGNSADYGGAMSNDTSSPTLTNCSLQGNSAESSGGAMSNIDSSPALTNCVLWSNGGSNTFFHSNATTRLYYSLYEPESVTTGVDITGPGNFTTTTSPFVSATSVALAACSPAINAGNPASATAASGPYSATALPATDLTGNVRITGTRIDMGAVEYQQQNGVPLQIVQQPVAGSIVCAGTTVVMSVSLTGSAPAYQWYQSGTALTGIASATTTSLTLTNTQLTDIGSYSVVISGDCPSVTSTAFSLSVNALPSVTVTAAPSTTLSCTNPSLTLTAQTSATAFAWSSGGSTGQTLPVSQTGVYSVTVTDGNGCTAVSNSPAISRDNTSPTVSISAISNQLTCTQPQLTLTATASVTALRWSTGETTTTIAVSTIGVYSVTVTDGNGCTAVSNSLTIAQDNTSPTVSVSAISNQLTCTQPQLTLTATASATALRWSTGETTTTIAVSTTGVYSVTATGTNGCTVVSNNLPVTENFSLTPFSVSSATVCTGQSVNLTASGCSGQILWSTGATTAMITLTAGNSTSLLTATCTAGICSTTANGQVVVGGIQPPPAQILSFTADESACPVRLVGRGIASSFTMTGPKDYVFSTVYREGATHEAIGLNVKQAGTYTLTATYTNSCGTSAPVTRTVTVNRNCP